MPVVVRSHLEEGELILGDLQNLCLRLVFSRTGYFPNFSHFPTLLLKDNAHCTRRQDLQRGWKVLSLTQQQLITRVLNRLLALNKTLWKQMVYVLRLFSFQPSPLHPVRPRGVSLTVP